MAVADAATCARKREASAEAAAVVDASAATLARDFPFLRQFTLHDARDPLRSLSLSLPLPHFLLSLPASLDSFETTPDCLSAPLVSATRRPPLDGCCSSSRWRQRRRFLSLLSSRVSLSPSRARAPRSLPLRRLPRSRVHAVRLSERDLCLHLSRTCFDRRRVKKPAPSLPSLSLSPSLASVSLSLTHPTKTTSTASSAHACIHVLSTLPVSLPLACSLSCRK